VPRSLHQSDDRAARFSQEYAKDFNATQAAIRSGYAAKGAHVTASRLLRRPKVRAAIDAILAKAAQATGITVERTLKEIARIAYGDHRRLYDDKNNLRAIGSLDDDSAALLAGVEVFEEYEGRGEERELVGYTRKVKTWSKVKALDQCMAYLGMHKTGGPGEASSLNLSINLSGGKAVR
jgi:phage terminase small subunit